LRGETYIENFERLPNGSGHLLLHIDNKKKNELLGDDPDKIKGKYKYRLKRIGPLGDWECSYSSQPPASKKAHLLSDDTKSSEQSSKSNKTSKKGNHFIKTDYLLKAL
jgi:hypothetical protein